MTSNFTFRPLLLLALLFCSAVLTVYATDTSGNRGGATVLLSSDHAAPLAQCTPISTLDCDDIAVTLPFSLSFSGTEGGLDDGDTDQTGFTMVDNHSETRLTEDGPASNPMVNGYEPGQLDVTGGNLVIAANKGIAYLNNNTQINTLGVGLENLTNTFSIETTLLGINTGSSSAQAGLWFGTDEDNFVKLNVNDNNVEVRREIGGNSVSADQIQVNNVGVANQNVTLRLEINPTAMTITAFYTINNGTEIQVTQSGSNNLPLPPGYLDGRMLDANNTLSFAGVYATYRNNTTSFDATFDYFAVEEITVPNSPPTASFTATPTDLTTYFDGTASSDPDGVIASYSWNFGDGSGTSTDPTPNYAYASAGTYSVSLTVTDDDNDTDMTTQSVTVENPGIGTFPYRVNFQDPSSTPPTDYLRDSGEPYDRRNGQDQGTDGLVYGWLTTDATMLLDLTGNGRNRERAVATLLQNTLIHMQYGDTGGSNGNPNEGIWEISVPNGNYEVTVSVGDQPNYDSQHRIVVEGILMIDQFQGSAAQEYETSTTTAVMVSDGRLTLSATGGGVNTKVNAVVICPTTASFCSSALPVTFSEWRGQAFDGRAELYWSTSAEQDNRGFYIERSNDGRTFREIGFVPGQGDSELVNRYRFTDEAFTTDTYYRLRQEDFDGSYEFSSLLFLRHPSAGKGRFTLAPNPVAGDRVRLLTTDGKWQDTEIRASLYGVDGRRLATFRGTPDQLSEQLSAALSRITGQLFWLQLQVGNEEIQRIPILRQ